MVTLKRTSPSMLSMVDEGENDQNIICVLTDDPQYNSYIHVNELPEHVWKEMEQFFDAYTRRWKEKKQVYTGLLAQMESKRLLGSQLPRYNEQKR
jgi:inorganic pyrophosphatase